MFSLPIQDFHGLKPTHSYQFEQFQHQRQRNKVE